VLLSFSERMPECRQESRRSKTLGSVVLFTNYRRDNDTSLSCVFQGLLWLVSTYPCETTMGGDVHDNPHVQLVVSQMARSNNTVSGCACVMLQLPQHVSGCRLSQEKSRLVDIKISYP
jgi:hypothetical protein